MTHFSDLGLIPELLSNLETLGYSEATAVQSKAIPLVLKGRDLMAAAQTGTGKTAAFSLPLLHKLNVSGRSDSNSVRALMLVPTRELAEQVLQAVQGYTGSLPLRSYAVYGGVSINPQMMAMRKGMDILVATPGRLLDLYRHNAVKFDQLQYLVLDEADRMLDLGFAGELDEIFCAIPKKRQTLLFSATFSPRVKEMAGMMLHDPATVEVAAPNSAADTLTQWLIPTDKKRKTELLQHVVTQYKGQQILIFVKTRNTVDELENLFSAEGYKVTGIHGEKTQANRMSAMQSFRDGDTQILIATDVAARGLDVEELPMVINLELPANAEDYVHRIGRSGRKGKTGSAISLVCADEVQQLATIENMIGQLIERREEPGFEAIHRVPATELGGLIIKKTKKEKKKLIPGSGDSMAAAARKPKKSASGLRMFDHSDDGSGVRSGKSGGAKNSDRRRRKKS